MPLAKIRAHTARAASSSCLQTDPLRAAFEERFSVTDVLGQFCDYRALSESLDGQLRRWSRLRLRQYHGSNTILIGHLGAGRIDVGR